MYRCLVHDMDLASQGISIIDYHKALYSKALPCPTHMEVDQLI
jgi:hypothetical protein